MVSQNGSGAHSPAFNDISLASFSPDGSTIAFVRSNDLYTGELRDCTTSRPFALACCVLRVLRV
jgi:hypothetical protein